MKKLLVASTAVLLMSGSLGYADDPFIPNDNDHMSALSTVIGHGVDRQVWYGGRIVIATSNAGRVATGTSAAGRVSPGFLLHTDENGNKRVENQYAR